MLLTLLRMQNYQPQFSKMLKFNSQNTFRSFIIFFVVSAPYSAEKIRKILFNFPLSFSSSRVYFHKYIETMSCIEEMRFISYHTTINVDVNWSFFTHKIFFLFKIEILVVVYLSSIKKQSATCQEIFFTSSLQYTYQNQSNHFLLQRCVQSSMCGAFS